MSNNDSNVTVELQNDFVTYLTLWEIIITSTVLPVLLLLYCLVLWIYYRDKLKIFKNPYYMIVIGLGVCDLCMLTYTLYTFFYDIFGFAYLGMLFDSLSGYVLYWAMGWYGTQISNILVATNRFIAILYSDKYIRFTRKHALMLFIATVLINFAIVTPFYAVFGIYYVPLIKVAFFRYPIPQGWEWLYDAFVKWDITFSYTVAGYLIIIYITITIYLCWKLNNMSIINPSYVKEIKLFLQGVCMGILLCAVNVVHWYLFNGSFNRIGNLLYAGLNPVIYIILDRRVANEVLNFCWYVGKQLTCQYNRSSTLVVNLNI